MRQICAFLALVFCALMGASPAFAAPLKPTICIRAAAPGEGPAAEFARARGFDCSSPQTRFGPGDYWARMQGFSIAPNAGDRLIIRFVSMWQDRASVYFRYADGSIARQDYSAARASEFLTIGAFFEIPVPWKKAPLEAVLVRVENSANVRGIVLGSEILKEREALAGHARGIALYAGFAGVALTLIVYNLALWVAMRHRFQLYYCAMLAAIAAYAFSVSGALLFAFPELNNNVRLQFSYASLALTAITALLFARHFFGSRVMTPRLRLAVYVGNGFLAFTTITAIIVAQFDVRYFTSIYYAGYLPGAFAIAAVSVQALRSKTSFGRLFVLAWCWPVMAGGVRWLHGIGVIPYSFWVDNSSIITFAIEALVSSGVIAVRIKALSKERDKALEEESRARELARVDPLTGLFNRRGLLDTALGTDAHRQLVLFDIDHFKKINDSYGHDRGDKVLQAFALGLRKWSPEGAIVARIGGEEFAMLAPKGSFNRAAIDDLLQNIRALRPDGGLEVTASLGVAEGPFETEQDWQLLYRQADAALYRAKADGRDRFSIATQFAQAA